MPRHFTALLFALLALHASCGSSRPRSATQDYPTLATGEHRWSLGLGGPGNDAARDIAVLPSGDLIVVGSFEQTLTVAKRTTRAAGDTDGFVARLTPKGDAVWLKRVGGERSDTVLAVTVAADGNIAVAGLATPDATYEDAALPAPSKTAPESSGTVAFVAVLDQAGALRWIRYLESTIYASVADLCFSGDGSVVAVGHFGGTVDIGERRLSSAGKHDAVAASFSRDGRVRWARRAGGAGADLAEAVTCAPDRVRIAGGFTQHALVGSEELDGHGGGQDAFVATLDSNGAVLDAEAYGGEGNATAFAMVEANDGAYCIAGSFTKEANFGGDDLEARGQSDVFLACFAADGTHRWSKGLGGSGDDHARALALRGTDMVIAGTFSGSADFGGRELTSVGGNDLFATKLGPDGEAIWSRSFGAAGQDDVGGVALEAGGGLAMAGTFDQRISFGGDALTARGMLDGFATRLTD